jgi:hypothetical protein
MESRHSVGILVKEARPQRVGEQVVVAIPPALVVKGDQEEVAAIQPLQDCPTITASGDGIAKGSRQPVEDGCLEQEGPNVLGLAREHLVGEVVDDVTIVAREGRDEGGGVGSPLHRQGRELERRDPALRPCLERGDVGAGELEPHRAVQVRGGLFGREA